jgi:hypothetical protein
MEFKYTPSGKAYVIYNGVKWYQHKNRYFFCRNTIKGIYNTCLHRQIWYDHHGEIPKKYQIHHIDRNPANNDISNLEMLHYTEHLAGHGNSEIGYQRALKWQQAGQKAAKAWHSSPAGIDWHRQHALKCKIGERTYGESNCENCKAVFTKGSSFSKFCSSNCKSAFRRKNNPDKKITQCVGCGKDFETLKYLPRKYCSRQCTPPPNPHGTPANLNRGCPKEIRYKNKKLP